MIETVLKDKFGYDNFRPGQEEAVQAALSGKNSLVMLPTGTGKSLCYQLPSYFLDGLTVIISPLLSLMQDQVESIKMRGERRVAAISSLNSKQERQYILNNLHQFRYLFLSPEMISTPRIIKALKKQPISLFVVDEAHCISEWGMDFRPEYLQLVEAIKELSFPPVMALTATATEKVRQEIIDYLLLENRELVSVIYPVDRPEIYYHVEVCEQNKDDTLFQYIEKLNGPGIIYFRNKLECERISKEIQNVLGIKSLYYHGDVGTIDREKIQQQFFSGEIDIICATSAFGMGIDKEDVRFVIHYQLPESPEMYLQEVGRVSRDKQLGVAILLYESGDENIHYYFQNQAKIDPATIQYIYNHYDTLNEFHMENALEKSIYYFAKTRTPVEFVYQKLKNHQLEQTRQLNYMMDYIFNNGCKRKFLLDYFNEEKKIEYPCCSYCHPEFIQEILNRPSVTLKEQQKQTGGWEQVITKIFKNISVS